MKVLTVQQPWAWAIAAGAKTVENRTQAFKHRGPLAIHAGTRWSDRGAASRLVAEAWGAEQGLVVPCHPMRRADLFPVGAVVAVVELDDVHWGNGCCEPWGEAAYVEHGGRLRSTIAHLVLDDIVALPTPVPVRGRLGIWTLPREVEAHVDRQVHIARRAETTP